jgi:hypothetical protein
MRFDVVVGKNVGPLRFGMTRDEVAAAMGATAERFMRNPKDASPEDAFSDHELFARYDENDRLREVEIGAAVNVYVDGVSLGLPYSKLVAFARRRDPSLTENDENDGFEAPAIGLSAYTSKPDSEWDTEPADSVCFSPASS